jgi:hypothetical protein
MERLIKELVHEFKNIRKFMSERSALNMACGLMLFAIVCLYMFFDAIGDLAKLGSIQASDGDAAKTGLVLAMLFILAVFFLLCVKFTSNSSEGD